MSAGPYAQTEDDMFVHAAVIFGAAFSFSFAFYYLAQTVIIVASVYSSDGLVHRLSSGHVWIRIFIISFGVTLGVLFTLVATSYTNGV